MDDLVLAILSKPRETVRMGKALFYQQRETGMEAAYQLAGQTMACNMAHPVAQEGVQAFIDKRPPAWRAMPVPVPEPMAAAPGVGHGTTHDAKAGV